MTPKNAMAKFLLWVIIKLGQVQGLLGGVGHSPCVCMIEPWEPPDVGPWEGVCSLRICPYYEACLKKWGR